MATDSIKKSFICTLICLYALTSCIDTNYSNLNIVVPRVQNTYKEQYKSTDRRIPGILENDMYSFFKIKPSNLVISRSFSLNRNNTDHWQGKGIILFRDDYIYLTAYDNSTTLTKGTVIRMNLNDGAGWKDIGENYDIDGAISGLTQVDDKIIAVSPSGKSYLFMTYRLISTNTTIGGKNIVNYNNNLYISGDTLVKTNWNLSYTDYPVLISTGETVNFLKAILGFSDKSVIPNVYPTAGIYSDDFGIYFISNNIIKMRDWSGKVKDLITSDISNPVAIATDTRYEDIYVLDSTKKLKRFNFDGKLIESVNIDVVKPVAITIDYQGMIYILDEGTTPKESKVLVYTPSSGKDSTYPSY